MWVLWSLIWLTQADPVRAFESHAALTRAKLAERPPAEMVSQTRQAEFSKRFNRLIDAMAAFSDEYNKYQGQVWPAKQAEQLRKAMEAVREIEPNLKK